MFGCELICGHRFSHKGRQLTQAILALAALGVAGCESASPAPMKQANRPQLSSAVPRVKTVPGEERHKSAGVHAKPSTSGPKPVTEAIRLESHAPASKDWFGTAVAVSGCYAVIGSGGDDTQGMDAGAAYVYQQQDDKNWRQVAKLHGDDISDHVRFGYSVALDDRIAAVGAERSGTFAGSVYVFERDEDNTWHQTAKLQASDRHPSQLFGARVAISGQRLLIGAQQDSVKYSSAGAAYLFEREEDGSWRQTAKFIGSDSAKSDQFGGAVAISGDVALVGSRHNDNNTGSAYVFEPTDGAWQQTAKLKAAVPTNYGQFGISLGVSSQTIMVGEWRNAIKGSQAGAVYVFRQGESGEWQPAKILFANDATPDDTFGYAVAVHRDRAVIGTLRMRGHDRNSSAYIFERTASDDWQQTAKLIASSGGSEDHFGSAVAIDNATVVVGAESDGDDSSSAAYLFPINASE
jgi:hypothetical protein